MQARNKISLTYAFLYDYKCLREINDKLDYCLTMRPVGLEALQGSLEAVCDIGEWCSIEQHTPIQWLNILKSFLNSKNRVESLTFISIIFSSLAFKLFSHFIYLFHQKSQLLLSTQETIFGNRTLKIPSGFKISICSKLVLTRVQQTFCSPQITRW